MKKIKQVLLVDDSPATNFFNKRIIEKTDYVQEVVVAENGKEALARLKSGNIPEIIFLDINMPIVNGWDFLLEFQNLEAAYKEIVIILMIGARLNTKEESFANSFTQIKEFTEKMLTVDIFKNIVEKHFHGYSVTV